MSAASTPAIAPNLGIDAALVEAVIGGKPVDAFPPRDHAFDPLRGESYCATTS